MKKTLLLLALAASSFTIAQTLQSENFNSLTVGNIGTNIAGAEAGQGDFKTQIGTGGTNGNNDSFQIVVAGGTNGNAFKMTGSNAATGSRFMWKEGLDLAWANRTAGNDIIEIEFDFNSSVASTSLNGFRLYIYSDEATSPKVLAGIGIATNAMVDGVSYSNVVSGYGFWTSTPGTGTYSFGLGPDASTPATLPLDTWVKLGFSFNTNTGQIIWKGPGFNSTFTGTTAFPVASEGLSPGEIDFVGVAGTGNAVADISLFDNYLAKASATDTLGLDTNVAASTSFVLYPNPATTVLNISNASNLEIKAISVTDINGRVIKNQKGTSAEINVADLNAGVYFVTIESNEGVSTKKFVKE